jgi:hypothetical protein
MNIAPLLPSDSGACGHVNRTNYLPHLGDSNTEPLDGLLLLDYEDRKRIKALLKSNIVKRKFQPNSNLPLVDELLKAKQLTVQQRIGIFFELSFQFASAEVTSECFCLIPSSRFCVGFEYTDKFVWITIVDSELDSTSGKFFNTAIDPRHRKQISRQLLRAIMPAVEKCCD